MGSRVLMPDRFGVRTCLILSDLPTHKTATSELWGDMLRVSDEGERLWYYRGLQSLTR